MQIPVEIPGDPKEISARNGSTFPGRFSCATVARLARRTDGGRERRGRG